MRGPPRPTSIARLNCLVQPECLSVYFGRVHADDQCYFDQRIRPHIDGSQIQLIDDVTEGRKCELFGAALAYLVTSPRSRGSSINALEAMACGTPTLAFRGGQLDDLVIDGRTGFLVHDMAGAVRAAAAAVRLNRAECRRQFEKRFTIDQITERYIDVYERVLMSSIGRPVLPSNDEPTRSGRAGSDDLPASGGMTGAGGTGGTRVAN